MKNEYYYFLKEHNICTRCRKEKAVKGFTMCADCLYYSSEYQAERRASMSPESKEFFSKKSSDAHKRLYYKRKNAGLCTRCGKHKAVKGTTKCTECRASYNRYMREFKHKRGVTPFELKGNGYYCSTCGKPVENAGDKLCKRCYENCRNVLRKAQLESRLSANSEHWKYKYGEIKK